jgi:integrase
VAEVRRVLEAAKGSDWYGMTLLGCYTGARLSDLAALTWRAVDLPKQEVAFVARKTGKRLVLPLAKPLVEYLTGLPSADDPDAPLFPSLTSKTTSQLSDGFRLVLVSAGLAKARTHKKTEDSQGRNAARPVAELSFHSLRHSCVTFLKAAGASDALAREIVGHETEAVNRAYTHLSTEDLRGAVEKLPDVTKGAK